MADEKSSVESKPVSEEPKKPVEEPEKKPAEEPPKKPEEPEKSQKSEISGKLEKSKISPTKPEQPKKPEQKPSEIKPEAFRRFMKHLIIVSKKQRARVKARAALEKHVEKLKGKTIAQLGDKKKFRSGLKGLSDKIDAVLETERELVGIEKEDLEIVKMLKDEIIDLKKRLRLTKGERNKYAGEHKRKTEDLSAELTEAKEKLSTYAKKKLEREERIHDLMEKIKSTPVKKHEIIAAKKQLEALERKFRQLSRKSYKSERLESLKERIDELKEKLAVV